MKFFNFLVFLSIFLVSSPQAYSHSNDDVLRAVGLAEYIAGDYDKAVASEGKKIINEDEFLEMQDFAGIIFGYIQKLTTADSPLLKQAGDLQKAIFQKDPVSGVQNRAVSLKNEIIRQFSIAVAPQKKPDLERGRALFLQSCSTCHGADGLSQTPAAGHFPIKPPAFANHEVLEKLSPFRVFNTVTFGIEKTPMPSFGMLSAEDRWAVASYVFLLRNNLSAPTTERAPIIDWEKTMALTDGELLALLSEKGLKDDVALSALSQVRHLNGKAPLTASSHKAGAEIEQTLKMLRDSVKALEEGKKEEALNLCVSAYLDGFEKTEAFFKSSGHGDLVNHIERDFLHLRKIIREGSTPDIVVASLTKNLTEAKNILQEEGVVNRWVSMTASFMIVFREGMEAILLLAIIFSVLQALKNDEYKKWVHASWVLALFVGFLTWLVARKVVSGAAREGLEGWVSLLAALVLLYVSFWLLAKKDAERWKQFLMGKIRGKTFGAFTISLVAFMAVYREVFESILFYEALSVQGTHQPVWLVSGVVLGFVVLIIIAWMILKLGKKIPLNLFFGVSGVLLYLLAVVFFGQGIHNLQEADFLPQTPIPFLTIPFLGIYPFAESLGVQFVFVVIFGLGLLWQLWVKVPREEKQLEQQMADTSVELLNVHELGEHLKEHLGELKKRLGRGDISKEEMREVVGHMEDLDEGIHHAIMRLEELQAHLPLQFEEIYRDVEGLKDKDEKQRLLEKVQKFKIHMSCLKHRTGE
ncbi:MAG TPA: hypothetical protein DDW49_07755 [Deltaproteobacteria bacterium]|nr:MAG: hypothetical protein A2048_07475 [Deltaproteobacteria bacterium GWA2_45_12]HBF13264.1 hypothetical protein [Deltaproteobacteria bacterium]